MTEKELKLLGFQSEDMNGFDDDDDYYYVLDIVDGLTFISQASSEVKSNQWYVEIFNTDPQIRFDKFEELQSLINLLNKRIVRL